MESKKEGKDLFSQNDEEFLGPMLGNKNQTATKSFFDPKNRLNQKNFFIGVEQELQEKMDKYSKPRASKEDLMKIPEPTVFKMDCPVKAIHMMEKVIMIANENGEIVVIDKLTFKELSRQVFINHPIIKLDQQYYAFMAQYKDPQGTIAIFKYYVTASGSHEIKLISKVETMVQSFTTFGSSLLTSITQTSEQDHITLITPDALAPHYPKVWVLNIETSQVERERTVEIKPNQSDTQDSYKKEKPADKGKKGAKSKKDQKVIPDEKPKEGAISCIQVRDHQRLTVEQMMRQKMGDDLNIEDHHEVFLGYETGAFGLMRIWLSKDEDRPYRIEHLVLISPQRVVTDLNTKHVLCMLPIKVKTEADMSNDFKLAVGFYSKYIQTFDLMESSEGSSYVFMDQKQSNVNYQEKPGISCLQSLKIGKKQLLVQGGFDFRVRLFSTKSLKQLINLKFHKGIINGVAVEARDPSQDKVDVYSISEDGYLACWNLDV